jgi:hypothetical protein
MAKNTRIIVQDGGSPKTEGEYLKEKLSSTTKVQDMIATDGKPEPESKPAETAKDEPAKPADDRLDKVLNRLDALEGSITAKDAEIEALKAKNAELEQEKQSAEDSAKGAIAELQSQHQARIDELEQEKTEVEGRVDRLEGLFKLTGNQHPATKSEAESMGTETPEMPNVNTILSANRSPGGLYKEVQSIIERAPIAEKYNAAQESVRVRDTREITSYMKRLRRDPQAWSQFVSDTEAYAKKNGLLRGPSTKIVDSNAATVGADIDGGFLDTLAAIMRTNNRPQYIFRNFANTRVDFAQGFGDTIKLPRAAYQAGPANPDDRLLSGGGSFANIDSNNQRLQTGTVSAVLQEWGLGKNSQHPPVGIPSFVQAYSMIDLMGILERNLAEDYYRWEDMKVRSLWAPTSRVVYNDGDEVSTTVGNADGSVTLQFLNNLYGYMRNLQIPTYQDGCYGIVLISSVCSKFRNEMIADNVWQAPSMMALTELANNLSVSVGLDVGPTELAAAYQGKLGNFHVFDTNAYGTGAVGAAGAAGEGVQTESVSGGSNTTRSNYAFGADTIGRGIGTEMEIRRDTNDNFGRVGRYIWRSEEGFVAMDVDPTGYSDTSEVPQQLRVIDVRSIG